MDPDEMAAGAPGGNPPAPPQPPPQAAAQRPPPMAPGFANFVRNQNTPQVSAPGPGDQAKGVALLQQIMGTATEALPMLVGMPAHTEVARFVERLSRILSKAGGGMPPAMQLLMNRDAGNAMKRQFLMQQVMGNQGQGQQPPMPSGAFPGA